MKLDDKSHGKPLEVGLYEGQAIKSDIFFLLPIAEGSKTRCVFSLFKQGWSSVPDVPT